MATIAFRVSDILCDMSVVSASLFRVVRSSTQLNVVNWVLQRDGDWECACADFKPTQESQVTSALTRASSELSQRSQVTFRAIKSLFRA